MTTLRLSNNETFTLQTACRDERNILHGLQRSSRTASMRDDLWSQRDAIRTIVANHLGLTRDEQCTVEHPDSWIRGKFNVCIFVQVEDNRGLVSRKVFRCPLPHKVGDVDSNVDDKLRAEVANYVWIEEKCPEIPTPHLVGFGFGRMKQYTHHNHLPILYRWVSKAIRFIKHILYPNAQTSAYVQRPESVEFSNPYILLECITSEMGRPLAHTWKCLPENSVKRENLFRGLSRIMLSFARIPHDRIGSLRFEDNGYISLTGPPLICSNMILESTGAPKVSRRTYDRSYAFVSDMLKFRDEAFVQQPNAVHDEEDCRLQMAHAVILKAVQGTFVDVHYDGPFVLQHPDLHASNIFVDEDWNITAIIDMEFVCALPPQMLDVPYWLTVPYIDDVVKNMDDYIQTQEAFLRILDEEQRQIPSRHAISIADEIRKASRSGADWFYHCLTSVNGTPSIVEGHLCPRFGYQPFMDEEEEFEKNMKALSHFWAVDSNNWVEKKVADKQQYDLDMQAHFESS